MPGKGELAIFNRSHYEGVLIERVHKIVPEEVWSHRYRQINDFERLLYEEDTTVLKFYLHIDKEEQKRRLQQRLGDPSKRWKFSGDDLPERKFWKEYMKAYEDAMNKTSTEWAPWYLIPANHKWYRDLVVSRVIVKAMEKMNLHHPKIGKKTVRAELSKLDSSDAPPKKHAFLYPPGWSIFPRPALRETTPNPYTDPCVATNYLNRVQ